MSSERFDKLMKKQLESVRPDYQPSAWNRFQKRLPRVGFFPWLVRFGGWVLSGLMLTGWVATLYSLHENQEIMQQLSKTLHNPAQATWPTPVAHTATAPTHRVDTVYIVKRTVVEHRHVYSTTGSLSSGNEQVVQADSPGESFVGLSGRYPEAAMRNSKITDPLRSQSGSNSRVSRSANQSVSSQIQSGKIKYNKLKARKKLPANADSIQTLVSNNTIPDETLETAKSQSRLVEVSGPPAVRSDSAAQKQVTPPVAAPAQTQPTQQRKPVVQFSSLKPRVGIESMVTPHGIGVGPAIELFPGENLGLSVGLQASQLHSENHRGLNDFNSATGKEFIDQYRSFLPAQYDRIEDISIQTSVISLPVSLKYYVPLRRSWSLLFQTGTSFDLSAYQQVWYESYFRGAEQHNSFEVKASTQFFHNFMFGTGIQFHKSRISGQLVPYYLYDFRNIVNTPNGSNFGLKAAIWLDLFK